MFKEVKVKCRCSIDPLGILKREWINVLNPLSVTFSQFSNPKDNFLSSDRDSNKIPNYLKCVSVNFELLFTLK